MSAEATKRMTREVTMLLDLAIARSRSCAHADHESKMVVREALEAAKQDIARLEELADESERDTILNAEESFAC